MHSHTFLVPAYKESPYLADCLKSLKNQTTASRIVISTSTPSTLTQDIAEEFGVDYHTHSPNKGIAHDWNFGLHKVQTQWVTVAHQDDVYLPDFTASVMKAISTTQNPSLIFTDYAEISERSVRSQTKLLKIKQALLQLGFLGRSAIKSRWSKTNVLRFGSPIPCPSVTFKTPIAEPLFEQGFKLNMDWAAWLKKAREPGEFVWIREVLMHHRIHEMSETTKGISQGYRAHEDLEILQRMWPRPIARAIAASYAIAYKSNSH